MAKANRTELIKRTHKVLKKHFTPVLPAADRSVLEHLLFACCLEDAPQEVAEEWLAKLQQLYFDWNEVRVTTVRELTDALGASTASAATAHRVKASLQSIFESLYEFDLEGLRKLKLGEAQQKLASFKGPTLFVQAYVTQAALGGHAIPLGTGSLRLLQVIGVCTDDEVRVGSVTGLERAIPKNQGPEFAALLHAAGTAFAADPTGASLRNVVLEIAPDSNDRLPAAGSKPASAASKKRGKGRGEQPAKKGAAAQSTSPAKPAKKKVTEKKPTAAKKPPAAKKPTKKTVAKKPNISASSKPAAKKSAASKSASKQLTRRKPR